MSSLPLGLRRATTMIMAGALFGALGVTTPPTAAAAPEAGLTRKLDAVLSDGRIDTTGAVVLDAQTGERLYSRNGSEPLLPASNTKIVTGAAALEVLGEGYRFRTEVIRRARVVDGVLQGRLYLKGYGDPTLRQCRPGPARPAGPGLRDHQGDRQAGRRRELLRLPALQPRLVHRVRRRVLRGSGRGADAGPQRRL